MPKREGAVIHIPDDVLGKMQVLAGRSEYISNTPTIVFDRSRIDFLADLSRSLLAMPQVRAMPDVVSFAYWCRRANLTQLIERIDKANRLRIGLGLSFHICPANVPINFAFSMAFGLLAGNTCVLRLPSKESPTVDVMVDAIFHVLQEPAHAELVDAILLTRFGRDDTVNQFWMSAADGRIVWGGDATVQHMRSLQCRPRSREVVFPDRYSMCAIEPNAVLALNAPELQALCNRLFNDIYLMDQTACSSPQLLAWIGDASAVASAKARLWPALVVFAADRYAPQGVHVMDKYVQACRHAIGNDRVMNVEQHGNLLYRIELSSVSEDQDECRGYFGTIHEVTLESLDQLAPIVNERYQTLTYFGLGTDRIREFIVSNHLRGIDRAVPIGRALDMDLVWDGYDLVSSLSRQIEIH